MKKLLTFMLTCALCYTAFAQMNDKNNIVYFGRETQYLYDEGAYLLKQIDKTLDEYPPTYPMTEAHKLALVSLDVLQHNTRFDGCKEMQDFINNRCLKVLDNLRNAKKPKKGLRIYKLYNDGFIVRSKSITFAIDFNRGEGLLFDGGTNGERGSVNLMSDSVATMLINECECLFITHNHSDHFDNFVVDRFLEQGKKVYAVRDYRANDDRITHVGDGKGVNKFSTGKLDVTIFPGHQEATPCNCYVIKTPEGYSVAHLGDEGGVPADYEWVQKAKESAPGLDVLLLTSWLPRPVTIINGFAPKFIITGHENEMRHTVDHRMGYWLTFINFDDHHQITTPYISMAWGEWYDFKR